MIYFATGRRENGKSTLVYALAQRLPQRIVIDPRRQFVTASPCVTTPDEVATAMDALSADPSLREVVVMPRGAVQPCFDALFESACGWIEDHPSRALAIIVDEARFFDLTGEAFEWVLRCAPRASMHVFLTAHRPSDIPVDVRGIMDQWLMFRTTQPHDLRAIAERCGESVAALVSTLGPYEWVQWDDGKALATVHRDPSVWYVPLRSVVQEVPSPMPLGVGVGQAANTRLFG